MSLSQEVQREVARLLREGKKIGAIKYLHDTYGFTLSQSKTLVEAVEEQPDPDAGNSGIQGTMSADEALKTEITTLLQQGKKIEAIKMAKDSLGIRLRGAKIWVEDIEREMVPHGPYTGVRPRPGGILLGIFIAIGLLFLGAAVYIYVNQSQSIQQSDRISGKVISMKQNNDGMSAPVIEYEWHGKKWVYSSTTYSSPPAFNVDEEVPVYVNRQDPDDITVDTFSERWLLIFILGVIGLFFTGIPLLVMHFTVRR